MIPRELSDFLNANQVRYAVISHSPAYTAAETAELAHVHGSEFTKVTMVKIDGNLAMAVLPATQRVDLGLLQGAANADRVELAHENEFRDRFPHCELGAMPPFGNLYDMKVFVEESLERNPYIYFNAGSHAELIRMPFSEFKTLLRPTICRIAGDYTN
ncbi:MAG: YbaK/EbsC family protein [Gammaproteobacteria bacterium]